MHLTKQDVLLLDIFSSSVLMGSDETGMPVPAFQSEPGGYHAYIRLEIAPEAAGEAVKVCMPPIQRYVKEPCFKDGSHISNFMEDDFEDIVLSAPYTCRNVISSEGEKAGLSLFTFDPLAAFGGGARLAAKLSSGGLSEWLEEDPVHLTATAYKDKASLVQNQASLVVQGKPDSGRMCIDSIVPGQQQGQAPAVMQEPGRISSTDNGGGGRGGNRGHRWTRGRGRRNRSYPY